MLTIQRLLNSPIPTSKLRENLRLRLEDMDIKATYLLQNQPETANAIIARGDAAFNGMLILPGTGGIPEFVGSPPCWLERRHDDNEFLWQLNRMTHWQDMLEAYSLTKNPKYAAKVIEELLNWIDTVEVPENLHEYPLSYFSECNPNRVLELGIRCYKTWPLILEHLGKTEYFTEEILEKYVESVYRQIKALRKVSPQLWPKADHNHFLMECLGALTIALYFPEIKEANEWKTYAIDGIERCAKAQLTEAGGQIEGCPSYHNGCMFWFGLALSLSKRFDFSFSEEFKRLYRKNLDYSIYSLRPTGKCVPVGDSHANSLASMAGIYGYFALGELTWLGLVNNFVDMDFIRQEASKHAWRAPNTSQFYEDLNTLADQKYLCQMPTALLNEELGQACIRSNWTKEALSFLLTCRSPIQNVHAHIDLMSFDFTALGKNIICDPGIFCYRDDEDRKMFKSTDYHSTILIDDQNQFEYINSFSYGPQKEGYVFRGEERGFYSVASAFHANYSPVTHTRHLALVDDTFLLIADVMTGLNQNNVKQYFHLDYTDVQVTDALVKGKDALANLTMLSYPPRPISLLPGRLSDENDIARESVRVMYEGTYTGRQCFITLLLPHKHAWDSPITIEKIGADDNVYDITLNKTYRLTLLNQDIQII